MDEEPERAKRWEGGYERTWEVLKEDESGSLKATVEEILFQSKRKRWEVFLFTSLGLGTVKHIFPQFLFIFMPFIFLPNVSPFSPFLKDIIFWFIKVFNDGSAFQVGIITTKNKRAEKLTELAGNPSKHVSALRKAVDTVCLGEPSLYNALSLAVSTLKHMPGHTSREVLVVMSSLTTCDPNNIYELIKTLKELRVRVSVIGLSAEVRVCTVLTRETGGSYHVILDEGHFRELLQIHVKPPPSTSASDCSLIRMGFPQHIMVNVNERDAKPSFSMAHLDAVVGSGLSLGGYFCPQCSAKYTELPVECKVCGLTLVSAPHLARSFHHLFPLESFTERPLEGHPGHRFCEACEGELRDKTVFECPSCSGVFCVDCDLFIHDTLHCCPLCIHRNSAT
uniref:General transcription factor IIH subunit n=1 Tax=Neogobius melanostomus TaxID=47308 RepID=A0A8C6U205_9GOBI